jgi:hypothetical protein
MVSSDSMSGIFPKPIPGLCCVIHSAQGRWSEFISLIKLGREELVCPPHILFIVDIYPARMISCHGYCLWLNWQVCLILSLSSLAYLVVTLSRTLKSWHLPVASVVFGCAVGGEGTLYLESKSRM